MSFESLKSLVDRRLAPKFIPGTWAPTCVVCDDSGWETYKDAEGRPWARRCPCRGAQAIQITGCPEEFRTVTFETFERYGQTEAAIVSVESWVPRGRDLFLYGSVGSGKTRLACTAANALRKVCRFELVESLMRALLQDGLDGELMAQVVNVPVLILDDVGLTDSDWSRRNLTTLYSERLAKQKRTIFTSNLSLKTIAETWNDERFGSRVAGAADIIRLDGPDYRRRK